MTFRALYGCHCTPKAAPKVPLVMLPSNPFKRPYQVDCVYTMTETGREDPKCEGCNRQSKVQHED